MPKCDFNRCCPVNLLQVSEYPFKEKNIKKNISAIT